MNINVNVDRQDVQQLDSAINKLKSFGSTRFYQEIQRGGLNAAYKVKKDAPYDTGNLRLNVKWDGKAKGQMHLILVIQNLAQKIKENKNTFLKIFQQKFKEQLEILKQKLKEL